MRILIIGGDGMLGHRLLGAWQHRHDVRVTLRRDLSDYQRHGLFTADNSCGRVDVRDTDRVLEVLGNFRPQAVVNAAGIIKQRTAARQHLPSLEVNAVFPHRLRQMCQAMRARLVHISTDCVFNGQQGGYTEQHPADAEDVYGLSKYLGEVAEPPGMTIRSSIIGLELKNKQSLIEWFLAQTGKIKGFTRAIYTGLTTAEMARVIETVITELPDLSGVWHVASEPINKCDLLTKLANLVGRTGVAIEPDDSFHCDRSLRGTAFNVKTGYSPPGWDEMLAELAEEIETRWRREFAEAA